MNHLLRTLIAALALFALSSTALAQQQPDVHGNVVVVLDASGSMSDGLSGNLTKMEGAKQALKSVLSKLPTDTYVGVLVFSAADQPPDGWAYKLGPRDQAKLDAAIDKIQPNGGTPLGEYIKIGADRLLSAKKAQQGYGSYQLLVVTDGEANDSDLCAAYTPDVIARGITFDVIGVKMDSEHQLKKWARIYRDAANPEAIRQAANAILAEVQNNGQAADNTFAVVSAAFTNDTAPAALRALASSGYQPIGERPQAESVPADSGGPGSPGSSSGASAPSSGCGNCHVGSGNGNSGATALVILVIGLVFARRSRRSRTEES